MNKQAARTLLLSLGNPLRGDDGVGAAVLLQLQDKTIAPHVELLEGGTPGLETVLLMQDFDRVIVIDAADMGLEPGVWQRFTPKMVRLQSRDMYLRGTLHYAGLAEALALGEALDILPQEIVIFGIQPAQIGWEPGLSAAVAAAIPALGAAILDELQANTGKGVMNV